jgi:hypothetical protein
MVVRLYILNIQNEDTFRFIYSTEVNKSFYIHTYVYFTKLIRDSFI